MSQAALPLRHIRNESNQKNNWGKMLSASTTERLIDPGIRDEVDDLEPVMKHKNFDKSSSVAFSINRYSILDHIVDLHV